MGAWKHLVVLAVLAAAAVAVAVLAVVVVAAAAAAAVVAAVPAIVSREMRMEEIGLAEFSVDALTSECEAA